MQPDEPRSERFDSVPNRPAYKPCPADSLQSLESVLFLQGAGNITRGRPISEVALPADASPTSGGTTLGKELTAVEMLSKLLEVLLQMFSCCAVLQQLEWSRWHGELTAMTFVTLLVVCSKH